MARQLCNGSAMEQDTLSTYHSIIPEEEEIQWVPLPNHDKLVQLHSKFWGENMQNEETKWRETQLEKEPTNIDVDNQTPEDVQEEDDIGPGSYILAIDIPGMGVPHLWVRQEYIRVYKFCEEYFDSRKEADLTPFVILTGQPGIGESRASRRNLLSKREELLDLLCPATMSR
jgi:hypothetical protein